MARAREATLKKPAGWWFDWTALAGVAPRDLSNKIPKGKRYSARQVYESNRDVLKGEQDPKKLAATIKNMKNTWAKMLRYERRIAGQIMTRLSPQDRVGAGGRREAGPMIPPKPTGEEIRIFGMTPETYYKAKVAQAVIDKAVGAEQEALKRGEALKYPHFGMTAEEYRAAKRQRETIDREEEKLSEDIRRAEQEKEPLRPFGKSLERVKAEAKAAAEITAEAEADVKKGYIFGMRPDEYRANQMLAVRLREEAEAATKGTPAEQRALAELDISPTSETLQRLVEEGHNPLVFEVLRPGILGRVAENTERALTAYFLRMMPEDTKDWTTRHIDRLKFNAQELSTVHHHLPVWQKAKLEKLVYKIVPYVPWSRLIPELQAIYKAVPEEERRRAVMVELPGPIPGLRVPIPPLVDMRWGRMRVPERGLRPLPAVTVPYGIGVPYKPPAPAVAPMAAKPAGARLIPARLEAGAAPAPPPKVRPLRRVTAAVEEMLPEVIQVGAATGMIPAGSPLVAGLGAYQVGVAAKALFTKMLPTAWAAAAGPLGVVIGLATLLSGFGAARKAAKKAREARRQAAAAGAARAIQYQVGYVPSRLREFQRIQPRRGAQRPFVPVFPSRLGLAATTPTPPARI